MADDAEGPDAGRAASLDAGFGPLERRVLDALWAHGREARVRDLQPQFPSTAYTTLMTTLDRLYRKGVLRRSKAGRAFLYAPRLSPEALAGESVGRTVRSLLGQGRQWLQPVLATFVDAVSERDVAALDELERLVRQHRGRAERRGRRP